MQIFQFAPGDTSQTVDLFLPDSSSTTGAGLSGLAFNTSGLKAYYRNTATGTVTAITLATQTVGGAYSSGGFVELDATNAKGMYRFDLPNAVLTSAGNGFVYIYGATNLAPVPVQIVVGYPKTNVIQVNGTAQTGRDIGASVLLSNGTGTGQVKLASGYVAMTWADVAAPTTAVDLSNTTIKTTQKVDVDTIKTNPVVNGGTITFPTTATLASTTNITAAAGCAVSSIGASVITAASIAADAITAAKIADGAIDTATFAGGTTIPRVTLADTLTTYTGNTPQTGDSFARLGAPAGASVSADLAEIEAETDDIAAIKAKTDNLPASPAAVGSAMTLTSTYDFAKGTVAVTESYSADGSAPTPVQALMLIQQALTEGAISGTTWTIRKIDGSTTAATVTLDSSTAPTSKTRAT